MSFSFDSEIEPLLEELVLSAQARTEYVPGDVKVVEGEVAVLVAPLASVDIVEEERSVIVPPPFDDVALWKKLEKELPVDALSMFEIVEEKV